MNTWPLNRIRKSRAGGDSWRGAVIGSSNSRTLRAINSWRSWSMARLRFTVLARNCLERMDYEADFLSLAAWNPLFTQNDPLHRSLGLALDRVGYESHRHLRASFVDCSPPVPKCLVSASRAIVTIRCLPVAPSCTISSEYYPAERLIASDRRRWPCPG